MNGDVRDIRQLMEKVDKCACGSCEPFEGQEGGANTTFKSDMSCSSVDIQYAVLYPSVTTRQLGGSTDRWDLFY